MQNYNIIMNRTSMDLKGRNISHRSDFEPIEFKVQTSISRLYISPYINPKINYKKKKHASCEINQTYLNALYNNLERSQGNDDLITPRIKFTPAFCPEIYRKIRSKEYK